MRSTDKQHRSILQKITHRAMLERGLLPDFSSEALAEPGRIQSAAAILLESRIGERFDAIVTGAAPKGTWLRILNPPIEGRLESGFEGLDVGHRLRVQLVRTDVERGYIDFKRVI